MQRRLRWTQVDEQEHSASPETPDAEETAPVTGTAMVPGRDRRGEGVRDVIISRGAGWAVAAAMAGAVVGLSVAMATSSSPTVVVQPDRAAGLRGTPAGTVRAVAPVGALRAVGPAVRVQAQALARLRIQAPARVRLQVPAGAPLQTPARLRIQAPAGGPLQAPARLLIQVPARVRLQVPAGGPVQTPALLRIQIPAGGPLQTPARLRIQIPAGGPLQTPARLRIQVPAAGPLQAPAQLRLLAPVPGPAGTLVPLPRAAQVLPGRQVIARAVTPQAVRLRVRPGQVRVRLRIPASGRLQMLPSGTVAGPLRVVVPGPRPAALVPAAPARLRIVSRNGTTIPAQSVVPAGLPGQARLRIQVPRARITKALPAPPN
jgi:hypothetical protein